MFTIWPQTIEEAVCDGRSAVPLHSDLLGWMPTTVILKWDSEWIATSSLRLEAYQVTGLIINGYSK